MTNEPQRTSAGRLNRDKTSIPFQYSLATKVGIKKINTVVGGHAMNHAKVSIGNTR